jgi:hypothetical protein
MTGTLHPHHMYASSAVQFRDPFASQDSYFERARANRIFHHRQLDPARAITPPPDMNGVYHAAKPVYHQQEQGHHCGEYAASQPTYKAQVAKYTSQDVAQALVQRNGTATHAGSRPLSPTVGPRQPVFEEPHTLSRRGSQANAIAPSFQIPRSVNDSGGSLSELAAQITCLFWFESAEILQAVEESTLPYRLPRDLVADAKPNTGFRKWVTTILSTTLVAQNVVLLALLFIYRLKKLNPAVRGKPGSEYRLLTVALMLGNKFLDDNTYTNKTWAEVSGIVVGEVHIMEVEFLSNMKYCLFTSAEDWAQWQTLLGKFASFFERTTRPQPPAPILPPASSLHLPAALPSPPASTQSSPPYLGDGSSYPAFAQHGPTPAPSPFVAMPEMPAVQHNSRKRSAEDQPVDMPHKRVAGGYPSYSSPSAFATGSRPQAQSSSRLPLPGPAIPASAAPAANLTLPSTQPPHLPPLNVPARAMAMVYPNASAQQSMPHLPAPVTSLSQPPSQAPSQYQSRQHSPYPGSSAASPSAELPHSAMSLHPPVQISPTFFLEQRNSPYRPIHNVSTLLYPPPSAALQQRPHNVEQSQMHYQPLGKSVQQRHVGRLPYVSQNVWLEGHTQHPMTPVHQWPSFMTALQQHVPPQ